MRSFRLDCTEFDTFSDRGARPGPKRKRKPMNWKTIRAITAAAFIGIIAGAATALLPSGADAAQTLTVENKALVDAVKGAQTEAKAGRYTEALAKAKEADAIQGKPAELTRQIHQMVVAYAIEAKDY